MVAKFCARSQGQPVFGVPSAAMISSRRPISREGVIAAILMGLAPKARDPIRHGIWRRPALPGCSQRGLAVRSADAYMGRTAAAHLAGARGQGPRPDLIAPCR